MLLLLSLLSLLLPLSFVTASPFGRRAVDQALTVASTSTRDSLFGLCIFIENNINYGTDGGIYAELIRNRAFQEGGNSDDINTGTLAYWNASNGADVQLTSSNPLSSALPKSVIVSGAKATGASYGLRNQGFFGIPIKSQAYTLSFYARSDASASVNIIAGLYESGSAQAAAEQAQSINVTPTWQQFNVTLTSTTDSSAYDNQFSLEFAKGSPDVQLTLISLFPPTWKDTIARPDLADVLADLKPLYFRLPGGNSLEGNSLKQHFVWNASVGALTTRPGRKGTWAGWDTDGYGLNEAYKLFNQMGAQPILDVFAGLMLDGTVIAEADLEPYLQSVKDELHYLTDTSGEWAEKRAADGQSAPWTLNWIEIGNEDYLSNGNDTYNAYRYERFTEAVKSVLPNVGVISSSSYYSPKDKLEAIDQHDYSVPDNLFSRWSERDSWPRNGTQVAELEFSNLNSGKCQGDIYSNACRLTDPTLIGALAEAAFMMGLERNGDITFSAAYAPLFKNEASHQWTPDLITFDTLNVVKTPSYYTQWAFGNNRVKQVHNVTASAPAGPVYWSVGKALEDASTFVVKLVNSESTAKSISVALESAKFVGGQGSVWQMTGEDEQAINSIKEPNTIKPTQRALEQAEVVDGSLQVTLPARSFTVVRLASSTA